MSETTPEPSATTQRTVATVAVVAAGLVVAAAVALWAHYGKAVFYEMILAGLNACF
jgi:hypothetical protein